MHRKPGCWICHEVLSIAVFLVLVCTLGQYEHQMIGLGTFFHLGHICICKDRLDVEACL